jgi:hypothetical protein
MHYLRIAGFAPDSPEIQGKRFCLVLGQLNYFLIQPMCENLSL